LRAGRTIQSADIECGNVYAAIAPWLLSHFVPLRYRAYTYGGELLALRRKGPKSALIRSVLQRAVSLYALGEYGRRMLGDAGIRRDVTIEPPRISLSYAPASRHEFRAPDGKGPIRILSVGRFVPHKGHAVLVNACALLPPEIEWRLVLAGSGPESAALQKLIGENGLGSRISIKEDLDDAALSDEYRCADLFILPSLETPLGTEGFGIVMLEAIAAGCGIIASRTGGIPEVLDEGACGILVRPGSPEALVRAVVDFAENGEARQCRIANAAKRLRERYAWA
jgi:glycosyltransferase involved in cell wall biosynthesis